jgi:hypothetical protein
MKAKELTTNYQMQRWMDIIRDCKASNLTVAQYCELNGLSRPSYYYWFAKIRKAALEVQQTADEARFVELSAPTTAATVVAQETTATIKVGTASIEISESISDEMLLRILKAVSHV